ncbi:hypothetical protein [Euzebya rosea]|uniref:hypothetical protein n=1 Tax=Euzebya rosea TaxID=2052804 RepID=UPI0013001DE7|nr:hypothetical protein [Euzebya rosea]
MTSREETSCDRCGRPHPGEPCGGERARIRPAQPQQVQTGRPGGPSTGGPGDRAAAQQQ